MLPCIYSLACRGAEITPYSGLASLRLDPYFQRGATIHWKHNMAWETRQRGGRCDTRSRRVNGQIVREYVDFGELAELAAAFDADMRTGRETSAACLARWERGVQLSQRLDQRFNTACLAVTRMDLGIHRLPPRQRVGTVAERVEIRFRGGRIGPSARGC